MTVDVVGWSIGVLGLALAGQQAWKARGTQQTLERLERALRGRAERGGRRSEEKLTFDLGPLPGGGRLRVTRDEIGYAIAGLPEREKLVVTLYYYEEMTMNEIAQVLGVSPTRVSQLHTKAILRLKARLLR